MSSWTFRAAKEIPWDSSAVWRLTWVPQMDTSEPDLYKDLPLWTPSDVITCMMLVNETNPAQRYRVCIPYAFPQRKFPPRGSMEVCIDPSWKFVDGKVLRDTSRPSLRSTILVLNNTRVSFTDILKRRERATPCVTPNTSLSKYGYTVADAYQTLSNSNKQKALDGVTDMMWGITECRRLMDLHGLQSWSLRVSEHLIRTAGFCSPSRGGGKVVLSSHLLNSTFVTRDEKRDTMLHEIAHALVPTSQQTNGKALEGHGPEWVAKAKEIGCSGERFHSLKFHPRCGQSLKKIRAKREAERKRQEALQTRKVEHEHEHEHVKHVVTDYDDIDEDFSDIDEEEAEYRAYIRMCGEDDDLM